LFAVRVDVDRLQTILMSIKGQLNACRDSLMAGMRATSRGSAPNAKAEALLRACMDLVEHLASQSLNVTTAEVETTLGVLEQAYGEMEAEVGATNAATVSLKNAIGRLRALRIEIGAK
jgi:hypothetical protein